MSEENKPEETGIDDLLSKEDKAFIESGPKMKTLSFGNNDGTPVVLHAFDTYRQTAAQSCGLSIFKAGRFAQLEDEKTYDGIVWDAVLVCWLCGMPTSTAMKALRKPAEIVNQAAAWQKHYEITVGSPRHAEILDVWTDYLEEILQSAAEFEAEDGDDPEEAETLGEP